MNYLLQSVGRVRPFLLCGLLAVSLRAQRGPVRLQVTPTNQLITVGGSPSQVQLFAGQGFFTGMGSPGGTLIPIAGGVSWNSSNPKAASVDPSSGLAIAVGGGATTITASRGGVSGSTVLLVGSAALSSITVGLSSSSAAKGTEVSATATGHFADSSTLDVTDAVTWSTTDTTKAIFNNSLGRRGVIVAVGSGCDPTFQTACAVGIIAALNGVDNSESPAVLTITPPALASVQVTPVSPSVAKGLTQQFKATGVLTDGSQVDLTKTGVCTEPFAPTCTTTWSASPSSVATIGPGTGLATAAGTGSASVSVNAVFNAISRSAVTTFTVTPPVPVSVTLSPVNPSTLAGTSVQFTADAKLTDGSDDTTAQDFNWSSSNNAVATVNSAGNATAVSGGTASITAAAKVNGVSGSTTLTVTGNFGNIGDPYGCSDPDCKPLPPNPTKLTSCNNNLASGQYYLLQNDVSTSSGSACFTFRGPNTTLDLGGHSVTGRIISDQVNANGTTILHGSVTCNFPDSSNSFGCIWVTDGPDAVTAPLIIHHITVMNTSNSNSTAVRSIHVDWQASPQAPATRSSIHIFNVTSNIGNATGPRTPNININGNGQRVLANNNDLTCPAGANACQGVVCFSCDFVQMTNNKLTMQFGHTGNNDETARAMLCDGVNFSCEIDHNIIDTENNRGVRVRGLGSQTVASVHDNIFNNILATSNGVSTNNYDAAVQLCDPDSGNDNASQLSVFNNTFNFSGDGRAVVIRNCSPGPLIHDNLANTDQRGQAEFGLVRTPLNPSGGDKTFGIFCDTSYNGPSLNPDLEVQSTATLEYFGSDSVANDGGGTVIKLSSCHR